MQTYRPGVVRCSNLPPAQRLMTNACKTILDTMKAGTTLSRFNTAGAGLSSDEKVPLLLTEGKIVISTRFANGYGDED